MESYEKQSDYHSMLEVVLAPLKQLQTEPGITYSLVFGSKNYQVSLKIPILFISGDSEGQDKLVGRRLVYSNLKGTAHICRYCNIPYDKTEDPNLK